MPFELGLFLGIARNSDDKNCVVVDREQYRYQQFLSDIAGQDIKAHNNDPEAVVGVIRNWLRSSPTGGSIPGPSHLWGRYRRFKRRLPLICDDLRITPSELTFNDYATVVSEWIRMNPDF